MALWCCTQMERRCRRKFVSRLSPETDEMRRPNSERNSAPSAFTGPRVSKAMGTNNAYLAVLRAAACSATEPAEIALCDKYYAAQVWTTVASQDMHLPADQEMSVAPSGRLPSVRRRPDGSFMLGTSALCRCSKNG